MVALVVAECRRTNDAVKQNHVAAFADGVERPRKYLDIPVSGFFITKTNHQVGAIKLGQLEGIRIVVKREGDLGPL
jgi:hypothetical protein